MKLRFYAWIVDLAWLKTRTTNIRSYVFTFCDINKLDVVKLEESETRTRAEGKCFLAFRKFDIPSVYIPLYKQQKPFYIYFIK